VIGLLLVLLHVAGTTSEQVERVPKSASPRELQQFCWDGTSEVKNPDVAKRKLPQLPAKLASANVQRHMVTLKLCIDATGHVARSLVIISSGSAEVDQFYRDAVARWNLRPPVRDRQSIP
jgi:TonB family protein